MSNTAAYLPVIQTIEQQWSSLSVKKLTTSDTHSSFLLSGEQRLPASGDRINYTAIASHGMTDQSLTVIYIASIPEARTLTNSLYAFLLQASALMSPLEFIMDLQSDQLVIRQSQIINRQYALQSGSFIHACQWLIPHLTRALDQIARQQSSPADARHMADLLSESWFGELAND